MSNFELKDLFLFSLKCGIFIFRAHLQKCMNLFLFIFTKHVFVNELDEQLKKDLLR